MMKQLQAHAPFQGTNQQTASSYLLRDGPVRQTLNNASRVRTALVAWVPSHDEAWKQSCRRLSKARLFWHDFHRHPAAEAWQAVIADPALSGKAGTEMAGLLASHTHTLPAPCAQHFGALPTLKHTPALLPARRSHLLRGEQGAAARTRWPLRAATCESCCACIPDGCTDMMLGPGVWLAISRFSCLCSGSPDIPAVSYGEAPPDG